MSYETEKNLEKAKAKKAQRTGLPVGTKKPTTEADVQEAKENHRNRTYGNDAALQTPEEIAKEKRKGKKLEQNATKETIVDSPDEARVKMIKRQQEAHKK